MWDEGNTDTPVCMIVVLVCLHINIAFVKDIISSRIAGCKQLSVARSMKYVELV